MQKIGAQYLVKRITDYVTAPAPALDDEAVPSAETDSIEGQVINDDAGNPLGKALRVQNLAVYVVSDGFGDRVEDLRDCLADPDSRLLFHNVDGRLAGLIYVPSPNRAPRRGGGMRASDV